MRWDKCILVALSVCLSLLSPQEAVPCPHVSAGRFCLTKTVLLGWPRGCSAPCPVPSCGSLADIQDDQVVEAVSRDKKRELPLEQVLVLTEETFHSSLSEPAQTVVLFYASCEYETWPGCPFPNLGMLLGLSRVLETSLNHEYVPRPSPWVSHPC